MAKKDIAYDPLPVGSEPAKTEAQEFHDVIVYMRESIPDQLAYQLIRAQIMRKLYEDLMAVGFTAEQALQICIAKGL